jgi:hypothetical protein
VKNLPTAAIKHRWNAHRRAELPWTYDVTKCASGQAIIDLGAAFNNFFRDCKKPRKQRKFRYPRFKRKSLNESFALWNDQFDLVGNRVRVPNLGWWGCVRNCVLSARSSALSYRFPAVGGSSQCKLTTVSMTLDVYGHLFPKSDATAKKRPETAPLHPY